MSKKRVKSEVEKLKEENETLREENIELKKKLTSKREKLKRSSENLLDLAERRAVEILREEERYGRIVVHVANGGIANFNDSPKSPPTSPKKGF
jgi:cell division septum initiation protein DivIVA